MLRESQRIFGIARGRVSSAARMRGLDAKVLAALLATLAVLCAYRFYSYWTTGFYVSDEYGYFFDAIHGAIYSDRWFFGWANIIIFKIFGITSVDAFSYLLPFYLFFWTGLTFIIIYKLLNLLEFDKVTTALTLATSFVLISFILLSLGFLTEPVGLCLAMAGVYFLARYLKAGTVKAKLAFPLLSACLFGFAAGTREPYNAFLVAGILIVILVALGRRKDGLRTHRFGEKTLMVVSIAAFVLPSLFFLSVPTHAYSQQIAPLSSQLAQSLTSNPVTSGGGATTSTITSAVTVNGTVTTTTSTVVKPPTYPFYKEFVLTNTLLIFFGGILLGWGPICFAIGLGGLLILLRSVVRRRESAPSFLLLTALTALGSYLVVSFIYAPDPTYFSFQNYSTLIRFSDTALPAYFLCAPLLLSLVAKSRKRVISLGLVVVIFLVAAVPVYQTYAASNLSYTTSNPFSLSYRSSAALIRDYAQSNPQDAPYYVVGMPYGWLLTPGVQDLHSVHVFLTVPYPGIPTLNYSNFVQYRWPVFYVYTLADNYSIGQQSTFIRDLLLHVSNSSAPYQEVSLQPIIQNGGQDLFRVQLAWSK